MSGSVTLIDREIGVKTVGLKFLDSTTDGFIKSAIVEAARESGLGELYRQKISELRDVLMQLYGLGWVVGTHDGYRQMSVIEGVETQFPQFGLPGLVGEDLTNAIAKPVDASTSATARAVGILSVITNLHLWVERFWLDAFDRLERSAQKGNRTDIDKSANCHDNEDGEA